MTWRMCIQVVIEERLIGPEVSVLCLSDGYTVVTLPPAQVMLPSDCCAIILKAPTDPKKLIVKVLVCVGSQARWGQRYGAEHGRHGSLCTNPYGGCGDDEGDHGHNHQTIN